MKTVKEFNDPRRRIEVKTGEEFVIVLDSNPTTGYGWQIGRELNPAVLKLSGSDFIPPLGGRLGAGGKEVWRFFAIGPGEAEIYLIYVRPWEKGIPPAQEANFAVMVR